MTLKVLLPAIARLLQRLFEDHLEGGKWANVSAELQDKTAGMPKHNKFSETIFSHVDCLLREKPNIPTIAMEAFVIFAHNHIAEWLVAKSPIQKGQHQRD